MLKKSERIAILFTRGILREVNHFYFSCARLRGEGRRFGGLASPRGNLSFSSLPKGRKGKGFPPRNSPFPLRTHSRMPNKTGKFSGSLRYFPVSYAVLYGTINADCGTGSIWYYLILRCAARFAAISARFAADFLAQSFCFSKSSSSEIFS